MASYHPKNRVLIHTENFRTHKVDNVQKCPSADKPLKNFRTKILNLLMTQTGETSSIRKNWNKAGSGQPIL